MVGAYIRSDCLGHCPVEGSQLEVLSYLWVVEEVLSYLWVVEDVLSYL